jgi:hypothetical protein
MKMATTISVNSTVSTVSLKQRLLAERQNANYSNYDEFLNQHINKQDTNVQFEHIRYLRGTNDPIYAQIMNPSTLSDRSTISDIGTVSNESLSDTNSHEKKENSITTTGTTTASSASISASTSASSLSTASQRSRSTVRSKPIRTKDPNHIPKSRRRRSVSTPTQFHLKSS